MKFFKRISYVILIMILLGVQITSPILNDEVEAKTLRDLKNELADMEKRYQEQLNQKAATQSEINAARSEITKISREKEEIEQEIIELNKQIEQLNQDIIIKNEEIRDIMVYYQLTATGEDAYLEYIFTATDFTDFIYRMAIAEQLSEYNKALIDEYNDLIVKNENTKKSLRDKNVQLTNKTKELEKKLKELQVRLQSQNEGAIGLADEIKILKNTIKIYEVDFKCNLDEDLKVCEAGKLPPGTAFYRPLISGRVSSEFGMRTYTLNGRPVTNFHYGTDFGGVAHGTRVYPVAPGRVVARMDRYNCGGNMLWIVHNVNGKRYTTGYYHLASFDVKVGDVVYLDTTIGRVGGNPSVEWWDTCTTGTHLHFQIATGHYMSDYTSINSFTANSFNARNVINMPALGVMFTDRNRKY